MHQKKSGKQQEDIGKVSSNCISSDFNQTTSSLLSYSQRFNRNYLESTPQKCPDFSIPNKPYLTIQIPFSPITPNPSPPATVSETTRTTTTTTTHHHKRPNIHHHEPSSNNASPTHALLSTPHKRPIMTHNSLSRSPTLSSFKNHHNHRQRIERLTSNSYLFQSFSCLTYIAIPFDTQELGRKLVHHLNRGRLLCFHLRFLVLLSLPSLYFWVSYPWRFLVLNLLALLAFLLTLLISLNLSLPRLPSIRLLLARSLPAKFSQRGSSSKSSKAVVWSIGSKPKSEKKANSGTWVQLYSNGDVYEGEFHRGKCSGSGVYYYHMKGRYEGNWIDGKYDGYGVETWVKGSRFRGQYRQGLRHGIGVYRFYTGDVYAGEWSNGQCHGCGVHTCEDGSKYVGEFKWGVKHGLGHYHFRNGDVYFGEYFSDKMHGFGVYQYGNGHRYEGAWHEGRRQGFGTYTFRNGETQSGHWENGVLDVRSTQNTHLGSPDAVTQSRVFNAVQEAGRAAEKANGIAKIDERVNKAVLAANKAANAARVVAVKAVQKQMHHHDSDDLPTAIA